MSNSKKKKRSRKSSDGSDIELTRMARVVTGVLFLALTIFTIKAFFSYIFTWDEDQTLAFNPSFASGDTVAANGSGKIGWIWAELLVGRLFGLGALALPILFLVIGIICFRIRNWNPVRLLLMAAFGAIILSVSLDYIFTLVGFGNFMGNGAGGVYGHYANLWMVSMIGNLGMGVLLLVVIFLYACLLSPKVAIRLDDALYAISHREKKQDIVAEISADEENPVDEESAGEVVGDENKVDDIPFEIEEDDDPSTRMLPDEEPEYDFADGTVRTDSPSDVNLVVEESDPIESLSDDEWRHLYDPRLDLPNFRTPPMSLLEDYHDKIYEVSREELEKNKQRIVNALDSYKIKVVGISAKTGPTVTLYKIRLADGVKVSQVRNLEEDIAISLGAKGVRVVTLLDSVGIEVANERASVVSLKSIINTQKFRDLKMEMPLAMGITVTNEPFYIDLAKMPHLLVAGATGTGKSVGLNVIISSLLFTKHPSELKLVLVDPKKVELSLYEKIDKHYLAMLPDGDEAIITDTRKVVNTMKSLCIEMDDRYDLLKKADVRQLKEYNEKFLQRRLNPLNGHKYLPYIVVIIDEFADLLMTAGREVEEPIARLAQKARAVGIHLVIATQRPTANIITGNIKANFISRIAFKVTSSLESRVIIDSIGANRLIGRGDMLVIHPGSDLTRVQCALIDTPEILRVVKFIADQPGYATPFELPEYVDENDVESVKDVDLRKRDQMFEESARLIVQTQLGSTSMLQRKLEIGYARAGRIMDQLEKAGIVGPQEGSKARTVLISDFDTLDRLLESLNHV